MMTQSPPKVLEYLQLDVLNKLEQGTFCLNPLIVQVIEYIGTDKNILLLFKQLIMLNG